ARQYYLHSALTGPSFLDNFHFWTAADPTLGYVHYVNRTIAEQNGMITIAGNATAWGVENVQVLDPDANLGRLSIRLTSIQSWTHGLFIIDLAHMPPNQCGSWPAFWTLGSGPWPANGEIDIVEYTNNVPNNLMALHTSGSPACTVAGSGQTGTLLTDNCAAAEGYTGCGISATVPNNIGSGFNAIAGGIYAMEWTSTAIRIWFFPRNEVPPSILGADSVLGPDPATFGVPMANFEGDCNIDAHFFNHSLVFDTTFCGSYAGNTWQGDSCPMGDPQNGWTSCEIFVAANPQVFKDAYWEVNYLRIYQ
ncbi:glycoside hydrolase family 16 protein, partial [Baudoinia panamericana UAMH 10762]